MSLSPQSFPSNAASISAPRAGFSASGGSSGSRPTAGATAALALDNMLRNQLRVSDPRDAKQIADGLLAYYQDLPQAVGIEQEAQGLPFLQTAALPMPPPRQPTSSDAEFNIANGDVEKALADLASNPADQRHHPGNAGVGGFDSHRDHAGPGPRRRGPRSDAARQGRSRCAASSANTRAWRASSARSRPA